MDFLAYLANPTSVTLWFCEVCYHSTEITGRGIKGFWLAAMMFFIAEVKEQGQKLANKWLDFVELCRIRAPRKRYLGKWSGERKLFACRG